MATSISERAGTDADDLTTNPSPRASIRMAGIADITAIARITQEGPQPTDVEPEMLARTTRLVLTHLAFEHGSLWVENGPDGAIVRAVAAVPGLEVSRTELMRRDVVPQVTAHLQLPTFPAPGQEHQGFRAAVSAVGPAWILAEISKASLNETGDPALLAAALAWTREQADRVPGPVVVLADTGPERAAAQRLGFVERRATNPRSDWWIGVEERAAGTPAT